MIHIKNTPTRKVKRIEVIRQSELVTETVCDGWELVEYEYERRIEEFIIQFEGEYKVQSMPLCGFSKYLPEGKECKPCKEMHFNLDP